MDIAALSETKLAGEGHLSEAGAGYTFFWIGKAENERREAGVGFAVHSSLLSRLDCHPRGINERIMVLRLSLSRGQCVTLVSVYAPTLTHSNESKNNFYDDLRNCLLSVPRHDKIILLGDFSARVGCSSDVWSGVPGLHGIGRMNSNGLLLLSLCQEFQLAITNTMFQLKNIYKGTWMHPRSHIWHMLDYVIVRQRDRRDVHITRVMRGADCWTDHQMLRTVMGLKLRRVVRPQLCVLPKRLDAGKLLVPEMQQIYQEALENGIAAKSDALASMNVTDHWETLRDVMYTSACSAVGVHRRRHQDWFDENDALIRDLLAEKHSAHQACLRDLSSEAARCRYRHLRGTVQSMLRTA